MSIKVGASFERAFVVDEIDIRNTWG